MFFAVNIRVTVSPMDETAFVKELGKYKVVRSRDFVDKGSTSKSSKRLPPIVDGTPAPGSAREVGASTIPVVSDFWIAFDAFLKLHISNSGHREKLARAFDEVGVC